MADVRFVLPVIAFVVTACQAAPQAASPPAASPPVASSADVAYYQYAGSKQCERGGKTLEVLQRELSAAGVATARASCGHDGRMYAQSCGMPDGRILVVHVPQSRAGAAASLGLKPLADLPEAAVVACR